MGGIKNKLNNNNKAKNLFNSLSLKERADERSSSGEVNSKEAKGSRLPSFSQPSEMLTRNISNTRMSNWWSLYASKTIGSLRLVTLTKYLAISCFTLVLISTIGLNLYRTYSSSNIESNAVGSNSNTNSELSTLANNSSICNPTNTNAAACISLSITSSSSSSTGGNDANLSLLIPQGGGIATGRHTVEVSSNNVAGYYVMLTGNAGSPAMTPSATTSQAFIQSTTGTLANPTYLDKGQWGSWGIALPNSSLYTGFNTNEMDYSSTDQDVLHKTTWAAVPGKESDDGDKTIIKTTASSKKTDSYPVYYGVRVDSPVSVPADTYAAQVVYTATTNEVPMPTITNINPNSYTLDSGASDQVTITGTNLSSTYSVYLTTTNGDKIGDCTNLSVADDTQLTCTVPTDQTNPDLEPGDYTIHVVTQGGEESIGFTYTEPKMKSSYSDYGEDGHVSVDYDANMVPITYVGNEATPKWVIADASNSNSDTNLNWYDYPNKKWANAVTLTKEGLDKYKGQPVGTEIDEQYVLGYWVYIPRYAYKVMRRDASNSAVSAQNFDIVFEVKNTPKKTPVECLNGDYQTCVRSQHGESGLTYPNTASQDDPLNNQTAWATHPSFTWTDGTEAGTTELNGFWIGKFETTGSTSQPTVLPSQRHMSQSSGNIGDMYDVAKSMGVEDSNNKYGNTTSAHQSNQNNNNLAISTSHMLKNSEWGAVTYLSASGYGVESTRPVQGNANTSTGKDGNGEYGYSMTGYGPGGGSAYNTYNGQRASTTNNTYGVYDMNGGAWEYVMGGYGIGQSNVNNFAYAAKPPYVDLYSIENSNDCAWSSSGRACGGHALFETARWYYATNTFFVNSSNNVWFKRGGLARDASDDRIFSSYSDNGRTEYGYYGFRVALLAE